MWRKAARKKIGSDRIVIFSEAISVVRFTKAPNKYYVCFISASSGFNILFVSYACCRYRIDENLIKIYFFWMWFRLRFILNRKSRYDCFVLL